MSAYAPNPVWGMAATSVDGYMLVHGGASHQNAPSVGTTFALRLGTSWNTSQPDIEQLYDDFPGYDIANTLSSDNKTWFLIANSTLHKFHVVNATWTQLTFSPSLTNKKGVRATTDPGSGMIYLVNGLSSNGSSSMLQYNLTTDTSNAIPMDPRMYSLSESAVIWSAARSSMLVHGRVFSNSGEVQQALYEFVPDDGVGTWTLLTDKGDMPGPRKGHCLVPAYGGSKIILFGGFRQPALGEHATSGIYSLDMKTLTWTWLGDPGERYGRAYHACTVSNDMFVSWGGADVNLGTIINNVTLVYNLKKNIWQTSYSPAPEGDYPEESSLLSLAAIIGIIAGSIVIALVGYVLYCKMQRQSKPFSNSSAGRLAGDRVPCGGSSHGISIKKHPFRSLEALEIGEIETGCPVATAEQLLQSHDTEKNSTHAYHGCSYTVPVGADLTRDETIYRPNEIIIKPTRGPQAIIDTCEYQSCASLARNPQCM
ncbi:hypothetical protein EC968_002632 [Mortierella alpina]|nr:hypothetical protein EC968_002632 [Mortierella alpina]